jgi:hypothetical protein
LRSNPGEESIRPLDVSGERRDRSTDAPASLWEATIMIVFNRIRYNA